MAVTVTLSPPDGSLAHARQTFANGDLHAAFYAGGLILLSGYNGVKPTYRAAVTYWAASPAIVGLTKTAFGLICAANLLPTAGDLNTIGAAILASSQLMTLLMNNDPTLRSGFTQ